MQDTIVNVGAQNSAERAEIEAQRGIVRNADGSIVRTKEWRIERAVTLEAKRVDTEQRLTAINAQIAENDEALASME